jgi:hypothetical protein
MAQKTIVTYVDDLDGTEHTEANAVQTVSFAVAGQHYEIDLHSGNAEGLQRALQPYVAAARKVTGGRGSVTAKPRGTGAKTAADREQTQAIRGWARQHGYPISDRGRIPADVVEAYNLGGTAANDAMARIVAGQRERVAARVSTGNGSAVQSTPEPATVG